MENQLSFENQAIFNHYETVYQLIENGKFKKCYDYFLEFLSTKVDSKFIISTLKLLQYWVQRVDKKFSIPPGKARIEFLTGEWVRFESFVSKNSLYHEKVFFHFKKSIFNQIVDNLVLGLDKNEHIETRYLFKIVVFYFENKEFDKAEDTITYLIKTREDDQVRNKFFLTNIYYFNDRKELCWSYLLKFFLIHDLPKLEDIYIPEILQVVRSLSHLAMSEKEIKIWLPVYLALDSLSIKEFWLNDINPQYLERKIEQLKLKFRSSNEEKEALLSKIIFYFLMILEKGNREYYLEDEGIWNLIAKTNENLFLKIKEKYVRRINRKN